MNRVRPCIQSGVVLARFLIDRLRIRGQLVVEAVEVDPLAALYEPLFVGAPEVEVPQHGTEDDLVPVTNARQRCIDHNPAGDPRGILCSQRIAHHVADVVSYESRLLHLECIHDTGDVNSLVLFGVAGVRVV